MNYDEEPLPPQPEYKYEPGSLAAAQHEEKLLDGIIHPSTVEQFKKSMEFTSTYSYKDAIFVQGIEAAVINTASIPSDGRHCKSCTCQTYADPVAEDDDLL